MSSVIAPPFTHDTALRKVQMAEDLWNSRDPERVALAYTLDAQWRNRAEFLQGREQIIAFLRRKWARELDYRLRKTLWGFRENRMAVTFEYEWHDRSGQWFRSYGTELWEFDPDGLMQRRLASINDAPIESTERRIHRYVRAAARVDSGSGSPVTRSAARCASGIETAVAT